MDRRDKGWHDDPKNPNQVRYWNGRKWTAYTETRAGSGGRIVHVEMGPGRRFWYFRAVWFPPVFYPLSWLNCSVPVTRHRLDGLLRAPEQRPPHRPYRPNDPPGAGVREPRRPPLGDPSTTQAIG
jgi:Protein of unknown function (DUF2510)